jgi:hypothetical protein
LDFYQFGLDVDKNARNKKKPEYERVIHYGEVQYIIELTIQPSEDLDIDEPERHILALVVPGNTGGNDATDGFDTFPRYKNSPAGLEPMRFIDLSSIECLVGRVLTRNHWYIIDRSFGVPRTAFVEVNNDEEF